MTILRRTLMFFLIFAGFPNHLFAADAHKGEMIAKRWCVACHIVSSDQPQGTTQAPPFSAVASKPDFNETTLAYFLLMPHPRMPDMNCRAVKRRISPLISGRKDNDGQLNGG